MDAVVHTQCFIVPVRHSMTFDDIYLALPHTSRPPLPSATPPWGGQRSNINNM